MSENETYHGQEQGFPINVIRPDVSAEEGANLLRMYLDELMYREVAVLMEAMEATQLTPKELVAFIEQHQEHLLAGTVLVPVIKWYADEARKNLGDAGYEELEAGIVADRQRAAEAMAEQRADEAFSGEDLA